MDKLSGLEVFVQTAQAQSFVAAGRLLGISASAVSKSISRLEERVAVRLFQRSTRSVRLTSEGEVFLARCRRIIEDVEAAENELSALNERPRGRLKVGLPLAAGLPLPVVSAFMARHPEIELDLAFSDRVADAIDEGLDVVIRGGELKDSRLVSKRLGISRLCLVATPGYLKARGTPVRPDDLVNHSCLHYRSPTSGKLEDWPFRKSSYTKSGLVLPMTLASSSLLALLHLAEDGRGIACVPDFAVQGALADGRLQVVLDTHLDSAIVFQILWPSSKHMAPKVRAFVDFVVERFGSELDAGAGQRKKRRVPTTTIDMER
ncbi:LysR family transcriptional regulator [Variovorax sp. J22R24]|uniref:LysR family transcriptional regulator n=1 Tax=Variovorax gracilis TaxID=3053502 RepID=UPI002574C122|nr:LysR family transcriptional regulator [Variovorax sp. J22R24]MDM0106588.1 LysR family transcriptional regulator [Variovorax sp. J22R24]